MLKQGFFYLFLYFEMKYLGFLIIVIFLVFLPQSIEAAAPPPPPPGGAPCWPPPCIPIDGGIVALMGAGALYAAKKIYAHKKEKNSLG